MPAWAQDLTIATQNVMDGQYLHGPGGLDNFYDQADAWIQTQTVKRGSNRAYVPEPFAMAIPRRQMVTFDADGNLSSAFLPADPAIQMPTLPAIPDPVAVIGPTSQPPQSPDLVIEQMLGGIMAKLVAIEQRQIAALAGK